MFALSTRGHLIAAKIEVKTAAQLTSCGPVFAFHMMDVEGLEVHGPPRDEIELRQALSEQVAVFGVDVVAPFNRATTFLDDANGIVVLHARERQFWDNDFDGLLVLTRPPIVDGLDVVFAGRIACNRRPNVVKHAFENTHHVVIGRPGGLDVEGDELVQVAVCVVLFGAEGRANLEDPLQAAAHAQLLEQLRGLVQEGGRIEIHHREQVRSAFRCGGHDLGCVRFDETLGDEVFTAVLEDLGS